MSQLLINNKTITLGSTIYQIRNITSIAKYKLKTNYFISLKAILICLGIAFQSTQATSSVNAFTMLGASIALAGIAERFARKTKFGVSIETSSASTRLITSPDEEFIDSVINRMHQVIQDQDTPASYTFNISEGDIINQSGTFETGVRV